ncbi:MAG: transglycosylase domain-containing protein [Thermomicrobiales bacterium]|nr:transglycosylase domain-containing protein [Thermomicrobiales bacterium]
MAQGKLGRSVSRYPATQRRRAKYASSRYGQRGRSLPPHLMPGVRNEKRKENPLMNRRTFIVAVLGLGLTLMLSFIAITVTSAVGGTWKIIRDFRKVNSSLPPAGPLFVNWFQTTRIRDREGRLLQEIEHPDYGWRTFVPMDQMAQDFINATVAAEDATFWTNHGIEPIAFLRAGMIMFSGVGSSGASTITQQLVRTTYPEQIDAADRSIDRKYREALVAVAMTQEFSKEDIFTMYVNQIFYGNRSYGIEAAANTYFNKHASELTLAESAFLAGIPQQPTTFTPTTEEGFNRAKNRQGYVLDQMQKLGYITRAERKAAWEEPLQVNRERREGLMKAAPHFTLFMHDYIVEHFGEEAIYGGFEFYTSIDLDVQAEAEEVIRQGVANVAKYNRNNAAMVVMTPWNGEILAMVGSADFKNEAIAGQVNFATAGIQPGSSMKPIAYAAAFEEGWHPGYVYMDVPTTWEVPGQTDYKPNNYTKLFYGAVNVRTGLANSFNIGAVKATEYAGVANVMDVAHRMGMKTSLDQEPSFYGVALGLGSGEVKLLEHTNVYATFANNGKYVPAMPLQRVEDSQGNILYETNQESTDKVSAQAIQSGIAYQITSILTDIEARSRVFGYENALTEAARALNRPTAAKSGTTENWRDLWTMGYTSACACGVWVGRSGDGGGELQQVDGTPAAGPIFGDMMRIMHTNPAFAHLIAGPDGQPMPKEFPVPDDVSKQEICAVTGHKPGPSEVKMEWIAEGLEPTRSRTDLSEWERKQLDNALKQVDRGANWADGAESSVLHYAAITGVREARIEPIEPIETRPDDSNGDTGDDSGDSENGDGDNPPIEPIEPEDEN